MLLINLSFGQKNWTFDTREIRPGFYSVEKISQNYNFPQTKKVRIHGAVKTPGLYLVPEFATLLDIISITGGPNPGADLSKIRIINFEINEQNEKQSSEAIINLKYYLQKGKFQVVPNIGYDVLIIVPRNKKRLFFDTLPKILSILNIISLIIVLKNL